MNIIEESLKILAAGNPDDRFQFLKRFLRVFTVDELDSVKGIVRKTRRKEFRSIGSVPQPVNVSQTASGHDREIEIQYNTGGELGGSRAVEVNLKISGREAPDRDRFRNDARADSRLNHRTEISKDRERNYSVKRDRSRDRDKDRNRNRDRGERNPDRDRDRGENMVERKRCRSRSNDKKYKNVEEYGEYKSRKRSRSTDEKKHSSRKSQDRKLGKPPQTDRDGESGDRDRGDRYRDRRGNYRIKTEDLEMRDIRVKQEPMDDYSNYDDSYYSGGGYMKPEPDY